MIVSAVIESADNESSGIIVFDTDNKSVVSSIDVTLPDRCAESLVKSNELLPAAILLPLASKTIVRNRTILTGTDNNFNAIFAVFLIDPEACKANKIKVF